MPGLMASVISYAHPHMEGVGSVMLSVLGAYLYARKVGLPLLLLPPTEGLDHFAHEGKDPEEWTQMWLREISEVLLPRRNVLLADEVSPTLAPRQIGPLVRDPILYGLNGILGIIQKMGAEVKANAYPPGPVPMTQSMAIHVEQYIERAKQLPVFHYVKPEPGIKYVLSDMFAGEAFARLISSDIISELRANYLQANRVQSRFEPGKITAALHVRRWQPADTNRDRWREYYEPGSVSDQFFRSIAVQLSSLYGTRLAVHVFFNGSADEIREYEQLVPGTVLHCATSAREDLRHLIMADILVMSHSAFSLLACCYRDGPALVRKHHMFPFLERIIHVGESNMLSPEQSRRLLAAVPAAHCVGPAIDPTQWAT